MGGVQGKDILSWNETALSDKIRSLGQNFEIYADTLQKIGGYNGPALLATTEEELEACLDELGVKALHRPRLRTEFRAVKDQVGRTVRVCESVCETIGETPLVSLSGLLSPGARSKVRLLGKLEAANPGGSVKDRIALRMVEGAERRGELTRGSGQTIIEATSGNTGIGKVIKDGVGGF